MQNFSQLNCSMSPWKRIQTVTAAKAYLLETITAHRRLWRRSSQSWPMDQRPISVAYRIVGNSLRAPHLLASNMRLRAAFGLRLIDSMEQLQSSTPGIRFFLVTLISDRWLALSREPIIWLKGMQTTISKVMLLGGFRGWFGLIEIQTIDHSERGFGRPLQPHFHAIAWTTDPSFNPEAAEARMLDQGRLWSTLGAPTAQVSYRVDTRACSLAAYISKAAWLAKFPVLSTITRSGFIFEKCALPPSSAVRQAEVMSGMHLPELVLSGGDGARIRADFKRWMEDAFCVPETWAISAEAALSFWAEQRRACNKGRHVGAITIDRTGRQLPPASPLTWAYPRVLPDSIPPVRRFEFVDWKGIIDGLLFDRSRAAATSPREDQQE